MPISKGKKAMNFVMREFKRGGLHSGNGGPVVKKRSQAIAIALKYQRAGRGK